MGQPAAKQGDTISGTDMHIVNVPGTPPTTQTLPHPLPECVDRLGITADQFGREIGIDERPNRGSAATDGIRVTQARVSVVIVDANGDQFKMRNSALHRIGQCSRQRDAKAGRADRRNEHQARRIRVAMTVDGRPATV